MPTRPVPVTDAMRRLSEAMSTDMFKEALKASLTELKEIEVTALCNAAHGERTDERTVVGNVFFQMGPDPSLSARLETQNMSSVGEAALEVACYPAVGSGSVSDGEPGSVSGGGEPPSAAGPCQSSG
jgi:hypothetical protein